MCMEKCAEPTVLILMFYVERLLDFQCDHINCAIYTIQQEHEFIIYKRTYRWTDI